MKNKPKASKSRSPLQVGNAVLIRTVTHYHTGRIVEMDEHSVVLEDAAWIADTGRFGTFLKTGELKEVEPFPGLVSVARGSIVDVTAWPHPLPREQK